MGHPPCRVSTSLRSPPPDWGPPRGHVGRGANEVPSLREYREPPERNAGRAPVRPPTACGRRGHGDICCPGTPVRELGAPFAWDTTRGEGRGSWHSSVVLERSRGRMSPGGRKRFRVLPAPGLGSEALGRQGGPTTAAGDEVDTVGPDPHGLHTEAPEPAMGAEGGIHVHDAPLRPRSPRCLRRCSEGEPLRRGGLHVCRQQPAPAPTSLSPVSAAPFRRCSPASTSRFVAIEGLLQVPSPPRWSTPLSFHRGRKTKRLGVTAGGAPEGM